MLNGICINERPLRYLMHQQGQFWDLKDKKDEWYRAYANELQKTVMQITRCTPRPPRTVLDIGCGLGVVDMLLMRSYNTQCVLIDGEDGDGVAHKYDQPYGSRAVVSEFMADNEIDPSLWQYHNPEQLDEDRAFPVFEAVFSFRSYCFHYAPETYLAFVQKHVAHGSTLILDVRRNDRWRERLNAIWSDNHVLESYEKVDRICYNVKGRRQ